MSTDTTYLQIGDEVRAFHPRMFGVVCEGRLVKRGRKYLYVDFGPLHGGTFRILPKYIV